MTTILYRDDSYLRQCEAIVSYTAEAAIGLDRTVFYALGGGQPGDTGVISWDGGEVEIIDTRYGEAGCIDHLTAAARALPVAGTRVLAKLNWERRYLHMRMHTALHLLGSLLPYGVTGGNISTQKSRLDFDTQASIDKDEVTRELLGLVAADKPLSCRWITDDELRSQPELVRTLSVQPPTGSGKIRLLEIAGTDLQPCGGTHVRSTGEVGAVRISKIENKGKHNRRVNIVLDQ